jgi:hypothetical protein
VWKWLKRNGLWLLPVVVLICTAIGAAIVTQNYSNPGVEWTALAGVLAAAAFVVAVIGLPVGLAQLRTVERDVSHLTAAGDLEQELNQCILVGQQIDARIAAAGDSALELAAGLLDLDFWVDKTAELIKTKTIESEANFFRAAGVGERPRTALDRKIRYIRDDLIPKVRAGYWVD